MKRLIKQLPILIGIIIGAAAFYVLYRTLRMHNFSEVIDHLSRLPLEILILALGVTFFDFFVLSGYDTLSIRYLKLPLPYPKIAFTSFVAYSFSHTLGFPLLTGGAVRYRLYSSWGLSPGEVGKTVLFNIITFWIGVLALGGAVLLIKPELLSRFHSFSLHELARPLGLILAATVAAYVIWSGTATRPLEFRGRRLDPPGFSLAAGQLTVSSADWASASLVVYILAHPYLQLSYPEFLGIYFLGQGISAASHVPGGLGVFESVMLVIAPDAHAGALLAALVAYRVIYFIIPLGLGAILFGLLQFTQRKFVAENPEPVGPAPVKSNA